MIRALPIVLLATLACATTRPADLQLKFLSPGELAVSPDGLRLYVVCEKSDELRVVDTTTGRVLKQIPVGHVPRGLSVSADGKQVYVANSWTDTISVIDAHKLTAVATLKTGFEPISAVADKKGEVLYVANRLSSDISVIDLHSGTEIERLAAGRGASYLALSADGRGCTARTSIRRSARTVPHLNLRSRLLIPLLAASLIACRCTIPPECFIWRFRQTASSASLPCFVPRTWCLLRMSSTAGR